MTKPRIGGGAKRAASPSIPSALKNEISTAAVAPVCNNSTPEVITDNVSTGESEVEDETEELMSGGVEEELAEIESRGGDPPELTLLDEANIAPNGTNSVQADDDDDDDIEEATNTQEIHPEEGLKDDAEEVKAEPEVVDAKNPNGDAKEVVAAVETMLEEASPIAAEKVVKVEEEANEAAEKKVEVVKEEVKAAAAKPENVYVRRQASIPHQTKKDSMPYNDVIEETASKLILEKRKNKVRALVGAFETVISLQEPDQQA